MFSFSSDAELVERSMSDEGDVTFACRSSSVPDIDDGRRSAADLVVVATAGGDFVDERPTPNAEDDMDGARTRDTPLGGDVVVERDARCRVAGGGPIEPSTVRVGLMVVGVGTLVLVVALVGVVAVVFIRTLLPSVVTRAVVEGTSEAALPTFGASLLSSERRDAGRDVWPGGENVLDSRRIWPTLLGAGVGPAVPLTLIRRFSCVCVFSHGPHRTQIETDQLEFLLLRIQRDVEALQVLAVPIALLLHLCDVDLAICALRLQVTDLLPEFLQLGLERAYTLTQCVHRNVDLTLPSDRSIQLGLCALRTRRKFRHYAAVFLGRACLFALECCEFGARIFNLVLVGNDAVGQLLKFGVSLTDVLVEACHAIIGCFELLPKRLCVRLEGVSEVVSVLTRFGQLGLELKTRCQPAPNKGKLKCVHT